MGERSWELVSVHDALILSLAGWLIPCVSVHKAYAKLMYLIVSLLSLLHPTTIPSPTLQHSSHSGAAMPLCGAR